MRRALAACLTSILLSSAALSACGTTQASRPPAAALLPVREELRQCEAMAPPQGASMPAEADEAAAAAYLEAIHGVAMPAQTVALMAAFAQLVQRTERGAWGEREIGHQTLAARACLKQGELLVVIDAANAANAEAAQ